MGKQPKVKDLPYTSLRVVLVGLFMNDIDDQEEKLDPRDDSTDSESELQSNLTNMSKPETSSSWKQTWDGFLLFPRFTLFFQNLSLDRVEGLGSGMHGLGSPRLRSAGGGLRGGRSSFGRSFATPGCISHLKGTPSPLL